MYTMTEKERNVYEVIEYVRKRGKCNHEFATDEDVDAFIDLFMNFSTRNYKGSTSYGLKHIAERVIGHMFYGSSTYAYVSNQQFKERMHKKGFLYSPADEKSINEYFAFTWKKGLKEILNVYNQL